MKGDGLRLVVFSLAGKAYAVPVEAVREILPIAELACPPGLPPEWAGLLTLDGEAVPVVSLARLLAAPEAPLGLYTPLVLLRGAPLALLVERVEEILAVPAGTEVPVPRHRSRHDAVRAGLLHGDRTVHILDVDRVRQAAEQAGAPA